MGGVSGVGGSGFYESHGSQPSQNQNLFDADAALNRLTERFSLADLFDAHYKLQKALEDPTLTPEQREHIQNAIESLDKAATKFYGTDTIDLSDIFRAQHEVKLALEV